MPYCSKCGIEVDDKIDICPLCATKIQILPPEEDEPQRYPPKATPNSIPPKRNKREMRKMAAIIVTFGLLIPASIAFTADLVLNGQVTWGTYTISTLIYIWILVLLALLYYRKPVITLFAYYLSTLIFLYSIDYFNKGIFWFYGLAFPIISITAILIVLVIFIARKSKRKELNILSYSVFALGVECIGIEFTINHFLSKTISLGWSIIVLAATIPAAGLLYYIHLKTRKPLKIQEYFHI